MLVISHTSYNIVFLIRVSNENIIEKLSGKAVRQINVFTAF